jgi:hypothetical protein
MLPSAVQRHLQVEAESDRLLSQALMEIDLPKCAALLSMMVSSAVVSG